MSNHPLPQKKPSWKAGFLWMILLACALFVCVQVSSFSLSSVSVDNTLKEGLNISESANIYPAVEIDTNFNLPFISSKLADLVLTEHTETCGSSCLSSGVTTLYKDMPLFDKLNFYTINEDGSRYLQSIRNYNIQISNSEIEKVVNDYEYICEDSGKISDNGTVIKECSNKLIGTHIEKEKVWIDYKEGEELKEGNYSWKVTGEKKADRVVDWVPIIDGKEVDELSVWGGFTINLLDINMTSYTTPSPYIVTYNGAFDGGYEPWKAYDGIADNSHMAYSGLSSTTANRNITIYLGNNFTIKNISFMGYTIRTPKNFNIWGSNGSGYNLIYSGVGSSSGDIWQNFNLNNSNSYSYYRFEIKTSWNSGGVGIYEIILFGKIYSNVNINFPLNNSYLNNSLVNFNVTTNIVGGANATNITLYLNGIENETKIITGATNETIFTRNLPEGNYNQSYIACDTDGDCGNSSVYYFTIDYSAPVINITSPTFENYLYQNKTLDLNYSITDATSSLSACWYIYNNQTKYFNCSLTNTTFNYTVGQNLIQVYANDTLNNVKNVNQSWGYYVLENSVSYNKNTMEGSLESFYLNTSVSTLDITSAVFNYKNRTQVSQINSNGNYRIIFIEDFEIEAVTSQENATFYWEITLSNGIKFNTTSRNQIIDNVGIDECTSYTYKLINMTLYDEALKTPLNGTIELFYEIQNYPNYNTIQYYNKTYSGVTSKTLCSNVNFSGTSFVQSAEIKYYANDYEKELYYIQKGNMNHIVNLGLYDLKSNDSTNFLINYQNNKMVKVKEAVVQLLRKYISQDLYEVVEAPLTSSEGTAVLHIDLNTNIYKAVVVKDGVILDTFDNLVFSCESPLSTQCTQNLYGNINPSNSISMENLQDFSYSVSSLNDTVTVIFSIPSGMPSTVNLLLKQTDYFGNSTLCNKTVTSSGGSIQCTFLKTIGDSVLNLYLYKDGDLISTESYLVPEENGLDFLNNNFFIVFIFILSLVGMAFSSPEWMIINSIITLLVAGSLWLLNGMNFVIGLGAIIWLVIAAAILINKLSQQEDR